MNDYKNFKCRNPGETGASASGRGSETDKPTAAPAAAAAAAAAADEDADVASAPAADGATEAGSDAEAAPPHSSEETPPDTGAPPPLAAEAEAEAAEEKGEVEAVDEVEAVAGDDSAALTAVEPPSNLQPSESSADEPSPVEAEVAETLLQTDEFLQQHGSALSPVEAEVAETSASGPASGRTRGRGKQQKGTTETDKTPLRDSKKVRKGEGKGGPTKRQR